MVNEAPRLRNVLSLNTNRGWMDLGLRAPAKFCYRHLPHTRISAVEIRSETIALREEFAIPPSGCVR